MKIPSSFDAPEQENHFPCTVGRFSCLIKHEELTYCQTKGDQQTEEGEKEGILGKQKKCRFGCIAHFDRHICSNHAVHLLEGASKCIELHGF